MQYRKMTLQTFFLTGVILFTGCTSTGTPTKKDFPASPGAFIYEGRNFGTNRNENYKQGVRDGCDTSQGLYTKNHAQFNGNNSYHIGWEHGRIHCNPADKAKYYSLIQR